MKNKRLILSLTSALLVCSVVIFFTFSANEKSQKYTPRKAKIHNQQGIKGAMEYIASIRNNQVTGEIDHNDIKKARKEVEAFAQSSNNKGVLNLTWEEKGPDNIGGRTRAILIDKDNPNIMFAGSVSGGIWKSTTAGSSWIKLNDMAENLAISCIAQDKFGNIYYGTGESFAPGGGIANGSTGFIGKGVFKSTDGNTFTLLSSTSTNWDFINEIACDPVNGRVYMATNKGLRYSDNQGTSWTLATGTPANANVEDVQVASDQSVAASISRRCYISTNAGASYTNQSAGQTGDLPSTGISRLELAYAPSDPNYIYASLAASDRQLLGIYRSTDKGDTWSVIGPGGSQTFQPFRNQGNYDNTIRVYPNNKDKILLGGIDLWEWHLGGTWTQKTLWFLNPKSSLYIHADQHTYVFNPTNPDIIYSGSDGGISRSVDGGQHWHTRNINYNTVQFYTVACSHDDKVMGGTQDNGTLAIDGYGNTPMNARKIQGGDGGWCAFSHIYPYAYFTTVYYGGLLRSPDIGITKRSFFSNRIENLGDTGTGAFASFVTPLLLWENVNDQNAQDTIAIVADTNYPAGTEVTVLSKTLSYPIKHTLTSAVIQGETIYIKDVVQSKFFVGLNGGVYMTRQVLDFSKIPDWYKIASVSGTSQCMAYSKDGDVLFVGTKSGNLYRISNLSLSYDSVNTDIVSANSVIEVKKLSNLNVSRPITSIAVDPTDANHIVVTLGNYGNTVYIYRSTNALDTSASGPTFYSRQGNLPKFPVYASVIEIINNNTVIVGTEYGVYLTKNINSPSPSWSDENTGLAHVPVYMIRQQTNNFPYKSITLTIQGEQFTLTFPQTENYGTIYVGTHGRGIFKTENYLSIKQPQPTIVSAKPTLSLYPNPVSDLANISINLENSAKTTINIYDISGRIVKTMDLGQKSAGTHKISIDCNDLSNGTYIAQMIAGKEKIASKFIVRK